MNKNANFFITWPFLGKEIDLKFINIYNKIFYLKLLTSMYNVFYQICVYYSNYDLKSLKYFHIFYITISIIYQYVFETFNNSM